MIRGISGQAVTQVLDGERRFDVAIRFLPQFCGTVEAISNIPVSTPSGGPIPLRDLADINKQTGASFIYREDNSRYIPIKFHVRVPVFQVTIAEAEAPIRNYVKQHPVDHYDWDCA